MLSLHTEFIYKNDVHLQVSAWKFFALRDCLLTGLAVGKSKMAMMDGLGQPE